MRPLKRNTKAKLKLNSVALVRERTIPTERPPPVGELVPTFADRGVSRGQRNGSPHDYDIENFSDINSSSSSSSSISDNETE